VRKCLPVFVFERVNGVLQAVIPFQMQNIDVIVNIILGL
jgi:hypothetical protein